MVRRGPGAASGRSAHPACLSPASLLSPVPPPPPPPPRQSFDTRGKGGGGVTALPLRRRRGSAERREKARRRRTGKAGRRRRRRREPGWKSLAPAAGGVPCSAHPGRVENASEGPGRRRRRRRSSRCKLTPGRSWSTQTSTLYFCSSSDIGKPSCCGFLLAQARASSPTWHFPNGLAFLTPGNSGSIIARADEDIQEKWP